MSYILEALKKSQAERQLGELPSIHAPQVQLHDGAASASARRTPVWLALGGVTVAVAAALLLWQPWQADAAAPAAPAVVPAMLAQAVPAPLPLAAPPAAVAPAPVAASVPPAAIAAPVHHARPVAEPKQETPGQAVSPPVAAPAPAVPPTPSVEESVPGMRDLPEPIQRQIPAIAIGGYIYSKNPADRLLLIDKVLRHEGEELAPGLVLEKLQPKAAIFSFKGYRYRVPY
ncbi:general secretion pathway protein GspB [Janthinobacterium tructae]|uniref:general secretion pathway protein GspB n=1 Tax=Janthinobacterium tructae TaxID=2590869 RepID=UPI00249A985A|nr:general secretion pathway protein GspB [Janthinobacterium tructae]MDI3292443.1 general secretion pathway protein GspB [Janthinobacterium tructae]